MGSGSGRTANGYGLGKVGGCSEVVQNGRH